MAKRTDKFDEVDQLAIELGIDDSEVVEEARRQDDPLTFLREFVAEPVLAEEQDTSKKDKTSVSPPVDASPADTAREYGRVGEVTCPVCANTGRYAVMTSITSRGPVAYYRCGVCGERKQFTRPRRSFKDRYPAPPNYDQR